MNNRRWWARWAKVVWALQVEGSSWARRWHMDTQEGDATLRREALEVWQGVLLSTGNLRE